MEPERASVTAMATALMRAHHTRTASRPLIDDSWGDRLVPQVVRDRLPGSELRSHPSYGMIIIRARYTEDVLAAAIGRGVRQYVIVGAGLDSFALRQPTFARGIEVFEIDHPATQSFKLRRLAECGLDRPAGVHFIAADLGREGIAQALARGPFDPDRPSFFSWMGVTAYLTREANLKTLRAIGSSGASGSELVFDYGDQSAYDSPPTDPAMVRARARVAGVGEPWISGFHPSMLGEELRACGLELVENLSPVELSARYGQPGENDLRPSAHHRLARARISP